MRKPLLPWLLMLCCSILHAQPPAKQKLYSAKIITMNDTISGVLFECTDSTISVMDMKIVKASIDPSYHEIEVILITELIHVKIRRTGYIQRGAVALGLIGRLTGAIIGYAGHPADEVGRIVDTFSAGYYTVQGALIGVAIGGTLGVLVGSGGKNFPINQQQQAYRITEKSLPSTSTFITTPLNKLIFNRLRWLTIT